MNIKNTKMFLIVACLCIIIFGRIFLTLTKPTTTQSTQNLSGAYQQSITTEEIQTGMDTTITEDIKTGGVSTGGVLTILMPGRLYNTGFQLLAQKMKTDYNINIHYKKIDNIAFYKQIIQGKNLTPSQLEDREGIDLYLIPTDRIDSYAGGTLPTNESIVPYVHQIFSKDIRIESGEFIPYAIDPLVTITPENTTIDPGKELTLKDISSFIVDQSAKNKVKIPIVRGLDRNDYKLLEQGGESFPNYFIITYNLIYQIYEGTSENGFNIFKDIINNPAISRRSYANFKIMFNKLFSKNPKCSTFPDICILSYNLGDIKFGFLSDTAIQQKYFSEGSDRTTKFSIYNFPKIATKYKVRGRGFVENPHSKNNKEGTLFIKTYLLAAINNTMPLWENILSAFNNILDIQKTQIKYSPITKFEADFSLIKHSATLQEDFLKNTNFISMIKGGNPIEDFFQDSDRIW